MFTPQQIDQISFGKATFGGYNMDDVDEFLEPLCEDYVTLYKENALLKSKMRVLVGKLEEYRKNEAAMKEAVAEAKKNCDKMVHEAELKCEQMMKNASVAAAPAGNADALVAAEEDRVEEARKVALPVATVLSCLAGMGFNVVADPVVGYFYKTYILGVPQDAAAIWAKMGAVTTLVNAIVAVITATIFYLALRPALKRSNLLPEV